MLLLIVLVLIVWYHAVSANHPAGELFFMMGVFAGLAYLAGFFDSRIFAKLDAKKRNELAEIEARAEQAQ